MMAIGEDAKIDKSGANKILQLLGASKEEEKSQGKDQGETGEKRETKEDEKASIPKIKDEEPKPDEPRKADASSVAKSMDKSPEKGITKGKEQDKAASQEKQATEPEKKETVSEDIPSDKKADEVAKEKEKNKRDPGGNLAKEVYRIARESEKKKKPPLKEQERVTKRIEMHPQLIAVWRTEGGAGATAFSCGLAHYLGKIGIRGVLLVDLNFAEGGSDAGFILNAAINPYIEKPKSGSIESMVQRGKGRKFDFLQSPPTIEFGEEIGADELSEILEMANRKYTVVIVDMPNEANARVAEVLERADTLFIISTLTDWPLARTKTIAEDLDVRARIVLVGNRTNGTRKNLKDIASVIGIEPGGIIEDDKSMKNALESHQIIEAGSFYEGVKKIANMYLFGLEEKKR